MNSREFWTLSISRTVITKITDYFLKLPEIEKTTYIDMGIDFKFISKYLKQPGYYGLKMNELITICISLSILKEKGLLDKRSINTLDKATIVLNEAKTCSLEGK